MYGTTMLTRIGAGIALAVAGTAVLGAGAAHAGPPTLPYYCSGSADASSYTARCWGGSGSFRAALTCATPGGLSYPVHGPWRGTAPSEALLASSTGTCDAGDTLTGAIVQRSADLVGEPN